MTDQPHNPTPPPPTDVAVAGWAGLTVRVAWTLLASGVRVRPLVLQDARDHVLYHLDPRTEPAHAEDRAGTLTQEFVARAKRSQRVDPWPSDGAMLLSPRWRKALAANLRPLTECVFRQHFGDGRSLDYLEKALQVDRISLEGARGSLREMLRQLAISDGLPVNDWPAERIDRLLSRLAAFSTGPCPPLSSLLAGQQRDHQRECARCDRAVRLITAGLITTQDLLPPAHHQRPTHRVTVLALHLHPDARAHRDRIAADLRASTFPIGDDVLLVDFSQPQEVVELLNMAAEVACPRREHLRGAVLDGSGRWCRHGLLGPVAGEAASVVRSRSWGMIDTVGELPAPLPEPPSAKRWWAGVGALGVAAAASLFLTFGDAATETMGASVDFTPGRAGFWTSFDVPEPALVAVVREQGGRLDVVLDSQRPSDKVAFAVGDGSYRLHTVGSGVLIAASSAPIPRLAEVVAAANKAEHPLADLQQRLHVVSPAATVRTTTGS